MTKRSLVTTVAWQAWGLPYIWGGDDPDGFDCSGFVIECLKSAGALPRSGDWTANGLLNLLEGGVKHPSAIEPGDLVFWCHRDGTATHVELIIDPVCCSMGASGGGGATLTRGDAMKKNAYVKVRPWGSRKGRKVFVDPYRKD